jgi:hypothetical protein
MSGRKKCSLCDDYYTGMGHNAEPLSKGRCCNSCNYLLVIPARLKQLKEMKENEV